MIATPWKDSKREMTCGSIWRHNLLWRWTIARSLKKGALSLVSIHRWHFWSFHVVYGLHISWHSLAMWVLEPSRELQPKTGDKAIKMRCFPSHFLIKWMIWAHIPRSPCDLGFLLTFKVVNHKPASWWRWSDQQKDTKLKTGIKYEIHEKAKAIDENVQQDH